ncbi:glutamate--cysteine ligase [Planosporangium flavigriseum]|nr:glutamate--cysteine ligase [Planosporangium flavigriseum]NJC65049.1 glutamate--cysteine ligase [Planosporangium flavigriseum]
MAVGNVDLRNVETGGSASSTIHLARQTVPAPLTLGVEEEYLLVDTGSGIAAARADEVEAAIDPSIRDQVSREFHATQLEVGTTVCTSLDDVRAQLAHLRRTVATAATSVGCQLLAVGTAVLDGPPAPVTDDYRYARMAQRFGAIADTSGQCGCHVHVGVPDRALALEVCNHLRPWLPILQSMTVNSPFSAGRDTGHASWRSVLWARWPSTGPTPYLRDLAEYEATIERLITAGVMLDEGMIYWYARPSTKYPTVEVRVSDVCATAEDATLVAALIRALVATVIDDIHAGVPVPQVADGLLAAAHWRAAHDGLEGIGFDVLTGVLTPAWQLVDRLVARVEPALVRHGDLAAVADLLTLLRERGSGAARQRRARSDGGLREVLALLARQTSGQ